MHVNVHTKLHNECMHCSVKEPLSRLITHQLKKYKICYFLEKRNDMLTSLSLFLQSVQIPHSDSLLYLCPAMMATSSLCIIRVLHILLDSDAWWWQTAKTLFFFVYKKSLIGAHVNGLAVKMEHLSKGWNKTINRSDCNKEYLLWQGYAQQKWGVPKAQILKINIHK